MTLRLAAAVLLAAGLALPVLAEDPPPDQRWVREMLSEDAACDPETARRLATAARRGIEREVHRREDSIRPPTAAAELSCLGDLMKSSSLDIAWPTQRMTADLPGFLQGVLRSALRSSGGSFGDLDLDAIAGGASDPTRILSSSLCGMAAARWNQGTLPVLSGFGDLGPFAALPAVSDSPLKRLLSPSAGGDPARVLGLGAGE